MPVAIGLYVYMLSWLEKIFITPTSHTYHHVNSTSQLHRFMTILSSVHIKLLKIHSSAVSLLTLGHLRCGQAKSVPCQSPSRFIHKLQWLSCPNCNFTTNLCRHLTDKDPRYTCIGGWKFWSLLRRVPTYREAPQTIVTTL